MNIETIKPGLIGSAWRDAGAVISLPDSIAKRLIQAGRAKKTDRLPDTERAVLNDNLESPETPRHKRK